MTALASYLSTFLREHLPKERRASPHTCEAYAASFTLLVCFAAERLKIRPFKLEIEQLDVPLILAFLEHIEEKRGNSAWTRNARLAAINAFFRYLEYRLPSCLDQAQRVHAIPMKKTDHALIDHLTREEMRALLDAPDPRTLPGARDRAMLHLTFAAGLGVSELVGLRLDQLERETASAVHVMGKGRRERVLRDHCNVVAIPTLEQEDAKRPNRERESLVAEHSRIVNRMKSVFALLGIRGFNPRLKSAADRLQSLRTPEGEPIPPHAIAALKRDMERRQLIRDQIRQIEQTRLESLQLTPKTGPHAMVCLLASVVGLGVGTADMLVHEVFARNMRDRRAVARYSGLTGSPDESGAKRREPPQRACR